MGHNRHFLSAISLGLLHSFINVEGLNPFDLKVKREVRDNVGAVRTPRELPAPARLEALVFEDVAPLTFPNLSLLTAVHGSYVFPSVRPD
jgi:hypothetical protein